MKRYFKSKRLLLGAFFLHCTLVHDESTFRSGEISPKQWFFKENTPFFRKDVVEAT